MIAPYADDWPGSETHREAVMTRLPRLLRVALTKSDGFDAIVDTLLAEVGAVDRRLEDRLKAAIDDHRFPELRLLRASVPPVAPVSVADVVRALDRKSVRAVPAAKGLGDLLLVIFGDPSDTKACARLAAACREALRGISAEGLAQSLAALAGMPPVDWRAVTRIVAEHAALQDDPDQEEIDLSLTRVEMPVSVDFKVNRALQLDAWRVAAREALAGARDLIVGLSCMAAGQSSARYAGSLGEHAMQLGERVLYPVRNTAEQRVVDRYERLLSGQRRKRAAVGTAPKPPAPDAHRAPPNKVPDGHVMVAPAVSGGSKVKEIVKGYEGIIGKPLPLVKTPDLVEVRRILELEFPHCGDIIGRILREMAGKPHVASRPLLVNGDPGTGKSRFARRLAELLGVGVLRVDGSGDGGVSFGGTERRWYSTEPCRPFMACARFLQANPMVLIDEIDKAPSRSDYGRLWDAALQFLEKETACRYPDPCLQAELDLSHVLILATSNNHDRLPGPLLDRFGAILEFPAPDRSHLEPLARHLAIEQESASGIDPRFFEPFDGHELAVMRRNWPGGSVRRLGRIVATVLRARDRRARVLPN